MGPLGEHIKLSQSECMPHFEQTRRQFAALSVICMLPLGCASVAHQEVQPIPMKVHQRTVTEIASLVPSRVRHRQDWGQAVHSALAANDLGTSLPRVCSVLAIIEQESGYQADPVVPHLSKLIRARLRQYVERFGKIGDLVLAELLALSIGEDGATIDARLKKVRTEQDVDRLFRDIVAHAEERFPKTLEVTKWLGKKLPLAELERLNPITTAGSMQVSVRFAQELGKKRGLDKVQVRDALYTRQGGVYYGSARLFDDEASYPSPLFRFADYNAGRYASRNAAFQAQVSRLSGHPLTLDGDVLSYRKDGSPNKTTTKTLRALFALRQGLGWKLSEADIRADATKEKSIDFEATETYRAVKRAYQKQTGNAPAYATVPQLELSSPKIQRKLTTQWFANNVQRRFEACLARGSAHK